QSNVRLNELGTDDKKEVLQDLRQMMEKDGRDEKEIKELIKELERDDVGALELRDVGGGDEGRAHAVAATAARGQLDDAATKNVEVYKKLEDEFRAMMASSPEMKQANDKLELAVGVTAGVGPTPLQLREMIARTIANTSVGVGADPQVSALMRRQLRLMNFDMHKLSRLDGGSSA
ncbi:MAG: hypothetical protein Q7T01_01595, partial [bacterium]|nr:hypothetical protein [bacterium]